MRSIVNTLRRSKSTNLESPFILCINQLPVENPVDFGINIRLAHELFILAALLECCLRWRHLNYFWNGNNSHSIANRFPLLVLPSRADKHDIVDIFRAHITHFEGAQPDRKWGTRIFLDNFID